ncbi:23S rRNA (guanosine(2251)-2'-O)-methyltransferase RlmB [Granulicella sp. WH15]|uniref:23S rRNA (guanosine(2251)-2'-O)-methyltransferase RlmB n=1 Tax=Granulicella sp. WH15 TaxID=2602070 RepID=UPI0013669316|nr:23S rRNA (guanosine(2251)-2'-O)-methyltransferase RlmB [Granulicella sp. WH15]QHN02269.1 23S rRNA (guanosine(2251)-2'-O)-methyltransferase RlmB [Granulicella sp. WH15]
MEVLYGLHPVEEAIRSGSRRLDYVLVSRDRRDKGDDRLQRIIDLCKAAGVRCSVESKDQLTRIARTDAHQGAVAAVRERQFLAIEDLIAAPPRFNRKFYLALDGVEDPHNLGALLRSADGAGVDGVLLPDRRSAPISGVVAKTSAGASEHVPIARVTNLVRSLEQLKKANTWVLGLDERGTPDYTDFDFNTDCVLVLGSEGTGLHDLVKKTCDHLLRIPMAGSVSSLNVSVAGAVVMYEALRQRRSPLAPPAVVAKPVKPRKGLGS